MDPEAGISGEHNMDNGQMPFLSYHVHDETRERQSGEAPGRKVNHLTRISDESRNRRRRSWQDDRRPNVGERPALRDCDNERSRSRFDRDKARGQEGRRDLHH